MITTLRVILATTALAIAPSTSPHTLGAERTPGAQKPETSFGLEGTWTHNIPWIDGKERTVILKGSRDGQGKAHFEMDARFYSFRPVFTEYSSKKGQIEILFKMVMYSNASYVSPYTLKYVLRQENGVWSGQYFQSWVKAPVDVILKKQQPNDRNA